MLDTVQTLLVLDQDPERSLGIKNLLEFMNLRVVLIDADTDPLQSSLNPGDVLAVFASQDGVEINMTVIDKLKLNCCALPVYLYGTDLIADELPMTVQNRIHGTLTLPLNYPSVMQAITDARSKGYLSDAAESREGMDEPLQRLAGSGPGINHVRNLIQQVSGSEVNVLILGESGTGKEVVARNIHYYSSRRHAPFVPVNCGAIPADLLESELFGHEKGAFTGAISARQGRFEMAQRGTLFLDEIGDMPLHMQVKMLRVLQERTFERVGSNKVIKADVRIIAATHQNLEKLVEEGRFRADLYYRLNVFPIDLPPLRQRLEDLPLLIEESQKRFRSTRNSNLKFSPAAMKVLCGYDWPGNIRELANVVERLAILYPGQTVQVDKLPEKYRRFIVDNAPEGAEARNPVPVDVELASRQLSLYGIDLKDYISTIETEMIVKALDLSEGVVAKAAKLLNLQRTTLVEKMRKYSINRQEVVSEN